MEGNINTLATGDTEAPTFYWFELHAHADDVVIDGIDDVLVPDLVCGDQTEVIGIRQGDKGFRHVFSVKVVAKKFFLKFKLMNHRVKHHKKNGG